jgi:glucokinase
MKPAATTVGVDLGGTKIRVALVTMRGEVTDHVEAPVPSPPHTEAVMDRIAELVRQLEDRNEREERDVGIGAAGQIAAGSGVVRFAPNLDWHDVPLRDGVAGRLDRRVVVDGDVRAATRGEWRFGAGRGCDDLVCVFVGTGVGGGIVAGGRLLSGATNTAGEIGHVPVELSGATCHCGSHGCLESLAGGRAIGERARAAIATRQEVGALLLRLAGGDVGAVTAATVATAHGLGDPLARSLVADAGRALAAGLAGVVNLLNPARLVLGGGLIAGLPELSERIERGIGLRALATPGGQVEVVTAELGDDAVAIGAATAAAEASGAVDRPSAPAAGKETS